MSTKRIAALRKQLKAHNLDGAVITHADHVRYLCGYTGSNGLVAVDQKGARFITDFRYGDQARTQVKGAKIAVADTGDLVVYLGKMKDFNRENARFAFAPEQMTVAQRNRLQLALPDVLLVAADHLVAELGWVKESDEIKSIEQACHIADVALGRVLGLVQPGLRERELAAELEYQMTMMGSERPAFETIVASGPRSAMPHGLASSRRLKKGDFVTFDFGATVNGYVSDMTRTVVVGKATKRQKRMYDIVLRAQKAGVSKIKAGVKARTVDSACRRIITRAGFGKKFGHGTGHGIGFYIHVGPRLAQVSKDVLKINNVVTVEPGIYISGWGGVRIEDDVVVGRTGGRVLNRAEKKLLEL
jgi:Xaa-Pro aminopeptidase